MARDSDADGGYDCLSWLPDDAVGEGASSRRRMWREERRVGEGPLIGGGEEGEKVGGELGELGEWAWRGNGVVGEAPMVAVIGLKGGVVWP